MNRIWKQAKKLFEGFIISVFFSCYHPALSPCKC
jgi:hypothetical protein